MLDTRGCVVLNELVGCCLASALLHDALIVVSGVVRSDEPVRKSRPEEQLAALALNRLAGSTASIIVTSWSMRDVYCVASTCSQSTAGFWVTMYCIYPCPRPIMNGVPTQ